MKQSSFSAKVARRFGRFVLPPRRLAFIAHKVA
jgi:hypothetical protein